RLTTDDSFAWHGGGAARHHTRWSAQTATEHPLIATAHAFCRRRPESGSVGILPAALRAVNRAGAAARSHLVASRAGEPAEPVWRDDRAPRLAHALTGRTIQLDASRRYGPNGET